MKTKLILILWILAAFIVTLFLINDCIKMFLGETTHDYAKALWYQVYIFINAALLAVCIYKIKKQWKKCKRKEN